MRTRVATFGSAALLLLAVAAAGGKKPAPPVGLPATHTNAASTLRFRTPAAWAVSSRPGDPELTEARGDGLYLRILRREGELGLDGLHVDCMLSRLAGEMQSSLDVAYEYDFVGGTLGARRVLDSAFVVEYDAPIDGARSWRQRNLTVVGAGESLCVIGFAPAREIKKSKDLRRLFDAVVGSVELRPWQ